MVTYSMMIFITYGFMYLYDYGKDCSRNHVLKKTFFLLACLPIVLVSALRYNVGTDYINIYWNTYETVTNGGDTVVGSSVSIEGGLLFLNKILSNFSASPIIFFVITSIYIYNTLFYCFKRDYGKLTFPVLIFFFSGLYFTSLNIVRQFIALAIVTYAFKYVKDRKVLPYIIFVLLAGVMHLSAIIMIPFYFLYNIKIDSKKFFFLLVIGSAVSPILIYIFNIIIKYTRYSYYANSNFFMVDADLAGTVYAILITAAVFMQYKKIQEKQDMNYMLYALLAYDVLIILSYSFPLCNRIAVYFKYPVFIRLIPVLIESVSLKYRKMVTMAVMVIMGVATYYLYYIRGNSDVFPYHSIFDLNV